jgi:ABC-type antimicrobial peptide transport system permease subunit
VPLGYEPEAVVEFEIPARDATRLKTMKDQMLQSTAIQTVSYSNTGASSGNTWGSNFNYHKDGERLENNTQVKFVDIDYIDTYQMTLLAGNNLTPADTVNGFIANESLVRLMGFETPAEAVGTPIELWGANGSVVGVVRDFNTNSLHQEIEATILSPAPALNRAYVGAARVNTAQLGDALAAIEQSWEAAFPDYIFEHVFLDERIGEFYESEQTIQQLIQTFALIAILIGCIGLFGLISYTTSQRAKEVGIRKVLGASAGSIVGLFTREFVVLVVLGFAVSAPVAYYVMQHWLDNFAYRINLGTGLFLVAFGVSLLIALGTVGFKTYRTAQINPVEAIRNE